MIGAPIALIMPPLIKTNLYFQFGAFIVYFFDYTIGSGWWLMVLYVMQLCAIFVIRGKPYSGEQVVSVLITKANFCASWLSPLLAFSWHVVRIISWLIFRTQNFPRRAIKVWVVENLTKRSNTLLCLVRIFATQTLAR